MGDQSPSGAGPVHHGERSGRRTGGGERVGHDSATEDGQSGVSGVRLHDDRATGGERAGRVATGDREREREVAGGEDRHRSQRHQHPAQVGAGRGPGRRIGRVDHGLQQRTLLDGGGEELQLDGGPGQLATEPDRAESGLPVGQRHQFVARSLQCGTDRAQQPGPLDRRQRRQYGGRRAAIRPARSTCPAELCATGAPTANPVRGSMPWSKPVDSTAISFTLGNTGRSDERSAGDDQLA